MASASDPMNTGDPDDETPIVVMNTTLADAIARVPHTIRNGECKLEHLCPRCVLDRAYEDRERAMDSLIEAAIEAGARWADNWSKGPRPTPASIREGRADADR